MVHSQIYMDYFDKLCVQYSSFTTFISLINVISEEMNFEFLKITFFTQTLKVQCEYKKVPSDLWFIFEDVATFG